MANTKPQPQPKPHETTQIEQLQSRLSELIEKWRRQQACDPEYGDIVGECADELTVILDAHKEKVSGHG
jgi:hypothetical protein